MPTSTNVPAHTVVKNSKTSLLSVSVASNPAAGRFSIHDCVDPGQATIMNCMWPPNNMHDPVAAQFGLCVHATDPAGHGTGQITLSYT